MPIRGEKRESTSIVQQYLTWKGGADAGHFVYRDKDKSENVIFDLKEFIIVKVGYTVKGFSTQHKSGFYSNEIDYFNEILDVKVHGAGTFIKGVYKDIKADLASGGARLHLALTVLHDGEVVQFFLKGKAYYAMSELLKTIDQTQTKIKFVEAKKMTDAAQPYMLPIFDQGSAITKKEAEKAGEVAGELTDYRDSRNETKIDDDDDVDSDLPFR